MEVCLISATLKAGSRTQHETSHQEELVAYLRELHCTYYESFKSLAHRVVLPSSELLHGNGFHQSFTLVQTLELIQKILNIGLDDVLNHGGRCRKEHDEVRGLSFQLDESPNALHQQLFYFFLVIHQRFCHIPNANLGLPNRLR